MTLDSGATVNLGGGGDLYAYEFIPGTGGSRDILDHYNPDEFSGNGGYQYPGGSQVYAIVPGLSSSPVAAYDPIYSANYSDLYSAANAGQSVYLSAAPGLAAGWYTLLPAQYAMLPGGMRVVEEMNGAADRAGHQRAADRWNAARRRLFRRCRNRYAHRHPRAFEVQSQSVFDQYSQIALTSADRSSRSWPRQRRGHAAPADRRRTAHPCAADRASSRAQPSSRRPAPGGRGSEVDITGSDFDIVSSLAHTANPGAIVRPREA